jgi:tRNA A37 threonylcarbamoyladenosine synthetase subunit TsaC/SUA5/YrdC
MKQTTKKNGQLLKKIVSLLDQLNFVVLYSVETTYGINSVISKLMTIVEITETGQFLFLIMLILSYFTCS